jgi:D-glycero-alpha-D-manno-heptose-7-phosphate kinase
MPVGKQDQYAAAFGGPNRIRFSPEGVVVEPLRLPPGTRDALQEGLMLFFTGVSRSSSNILHHLRQGILDNDDEVLDRLKTIKTLASEIGNALEQGDLSLFGDLLDCSWTEKRQLIKGITNTFIDECYQAARENGATGGKIGGAGGGGFLILYCPREDQARVTESLEALGLQRWPLTLDREGVQLMQARPWQRLSSDSMRWDAVPRPERQASGVP